MRVAKTQAIINILSGLWPLLHIKSFEAVTGKKEDDWLVKTIAWLFILSGLQLWKSSEDKRIAVLGIGWSAVIGGADVYYSVIRKRIRRVYLLDAPVQMLLIVRWLRSLASM